MTLMRERLRVASCSILRHEIDSQPEAISKFSQLHDISGGFLDAALIRRRFALGAESAAYSGEPYFGGQLSCRLDDT